MADTYRIDSHKLHYHPKRVSQWNDGENIYPIYMEISPSGTCNHRCTFCALDFMEYKKRYLNTETLKLRLTELAGLGLKSVMYAGEGEPFLHKDMVEITRHAKAAGIDQAFTTNATLMTPQISERILDVTSWIKVSCNAGTAESYAAVHRTKPSHFDRVLKNLEAAVEIRRKNGYGCALGMQILLLPETRDEVVHLAETARDIGLDYLVVKPYSQHPLSNTSDYKDVDYGDVNELADALEKTGTDTFNPIVRLNTIRKWQEKDRPYERCLGLPFWSYMDAGGNIWGCSMFLEDERFRYGNINEQTFKEIWEGEKRAKAMQWFLESFDPSYCRINCRIDEINRYLWELKNPAPHVNFI
jgi:radical SAM protein with 4Fe4S-binding SPASM domain